MLCVALLLLALLSTGGCAAALDAEGAALLMFKDRVETDPYGALTNWRELDRCSWFGVACSDDGRVVSLNLKDFCLKGTLTPELGKLIHLKSLILNNNLFYGTLPEEIGDLQKLQVLDLGYNNFSGPLPHDLERILSLQILVLRSSELMSNLSPQLHGLNVLSELMVDQEPIGSHMECPSRNKEYAMRRLLQTVDSLKGRHVNHRRHHRNHATTVSSSSSPSPSPLASPSHPPADPPSPAAFSPSPVHSTSRSSSNVSPSPQMNLTPANVPSPSELPQKKHTESWPIYTAVGGAVSVLLALSAIYTCCCRVSKVVTVMPWSSGLSGQLQKAFVTGVPSLKRSELERACEDFSNVVGALSDCMLYKGTLSNGVEIAVTSTMITLAKDWSAHHEVQFRKKISVMSKVNHKNFMSLLGYSEEEEPFTRMMVFEYAPNGTLFEHLHIREAEHLDWAMRIRIAMGIAYCLEYMHQLNPPVVIGNLNSSTVYLSDDYAAMVSDLVFWNYEAEPSDVPLSDIESVVYKFGIILVELISGRRPFSEDDGLLVLYASSYLTGQRPIRDMVDPTLESFRDEDVIALCEVIQPCINPDPRERPTMTEVVGRLRQITGMAPDGAVPKLSPLWWAELEINSGDGS